MKTKNIRFLFVKIPLNSSEQDLKNDNIQGMKQNIEVMNQILKNFFSIHSSNFIEKHFSQNYFVMEIFVEKEIIKFCVGVSHEYMETFEKTISSFIPGSVVEEIHQTKILEGGKFAFGGYFLLSKDDAFPIKTYESFEVDPMDSLLSAFSRVGYEEKLYLQILVSPLSENWQKKLRKTCENIKKGKNKGFFSKFIDFLKGFMETIDDKDKKSDDDKSGLSSSQTQSIDKKVEDEGFDIIIRALAISNIPERPEKIINDMTRSFNQYNYIGLNSFSFLNAEKIEIFLKDFITRSFNRPKFSFKKKLFSIKSQILNIKELSSIYHFPHHRFNKNPRIKRQNYKIMPAPDNLPNEGMLLGYNIYAGVKKDIKLRNEDRFRHFYIVGQTGTGKSTLLTVQAKEDMLNGNGFCLVDPHGDLCETLLQYYPKERIDDLIYFDASDFEMPIGFNIFEGGTEQENDIILNDSVDMFIKMYGPEIFGPRIQDYYRNGVLTLMDQPEGGTMPEIIRLFVDEAFQKIKLKNVKNPVVRSRWEKTFKSMGQREKSEIIPYFQSKFGPFTTTPQIRNIIGQPKSAFNIYECMQSNKIILLNLSKGKMGELNSQLLGTMMVTQIKLGALRRANIKISQRKDYFLFIDEFQNYITQSIETVLSEARKYRLGLVVAHQYIDQLVQKTLGGETDLRPAIFGNVGNLVSYKISAKDGEYIEKEFSPEFSRTDLVNMDKYKGVIRMSIENQSTKSFSISVLNPYTTPTNNEEKVNVIKEISRLKRGTKKELVEKEIYYRVGV